MYVGFGCLAQQGFPYALCRPASRRRAGKERFSEEKIAVRRPFLTAWVVPVGRPLPFGACRCLRDGVPMLYVAALFPRTGADCVLKRWSATVVPSSWKLRRLFHALPCQGRGRSAGCTERGPWIAQKPKAVASLTKPTIQAACQRPQLFPFTGRRPPLPRHLSARLFSVETARAWKRTVQLPHSMLISLNTPKISSRRKSAFSWPLLSSTAWPSCIISRRSPYSSA